MRKLILYIACSVDGYIATKENNIDFLNIVAKDGEDYGYTNFIETVDTVIVGRKTYDKVLSMGYEFPHVNKDTYILSRTPKEAIGNLKFYNGDLKELIDRLKSTEGGTIFCDGGAEIVNLLLELKAFDELYISYIPCLLGEGIRLFREGIPYQNLKLINSKSYDTGLLQVHYELE